MHRILVATLAVGACGHPVEVRHGRAAADPTGAPPHVHLGLAAASRAWLAGDLDAAAHVLEEGASDPRARALLARAYAIAGKPADASRAVAQLADTKVAIATDTTLISRATLSPDGAYVSTFEDSPQYGDGTVTVWSTVTGRDVFTIKATSARFGVEPRTGAMLVVAESDAHAHPELRAFDAATGAPVWSAESPHRVYDFAIDRHGTLTALTDYRGSLEQFDLATGALRREIPTDANAARLQISDDSSVAIAAETVLELPAAGTQANKLVEAPKYPLLAPDGQTLAIGLANGGVTFTERDATPRTTVANAGDDLQFLEDGTLLAFDKHHVVRYDTTGKLLGELDLPGDLAPIGYRSFVTGPSGHVLARRGRALVVFALAGDRAVLISTFGAATRATALAWSADGATLGLAAATQLQSLWTARGATGAELKAEYSRPIDRLAFDAATGKLAIGDRLQDLVGARIFVRDPDGTPVRFAEADEPLTTYARAGAVLVGAGESGRLHVWDADSGQGLGEVGRAGQPVEALALRPDGKLLAVARRRGGVELWDLPSRTQLLAITASAPAAAVTPDGRFDGDPHGLVRHAGEVDLPILASDAPTSGLAAAALATLPAPIAISPTPAARFAPRGCVPADEGTLQTTMATLAGDTLSYCLQAQNDDPYCFTASIASGAVVPAPAPLAVVAPPDPSSGFVRLEATSTGLRICTSARACHELPLKIDPQREPAALSADGARLAIDRERNGHVEILDASTGKRLARFAVQYGAAKQRHRSAAALGFLGRSVLAISVPCAGPCGEATIYSPRGKPLGDLGAEASELVATHFHDDIYALHSIDERFVVQDAGTGKILVNEEIAPHWGVATSPTRIVRISGTKSDTTGGTVQVYDAAVRPIARFETPRCPATN